VAFLGTLDPFRFPSHVEQDAAALVQGTRVTAPRVRRESDAGALGVRPATAEEDRRREQKNGDETE
jgi:hypothetical protein